MFAERSDTQGVTQRMMPISIASTSGTNLPEATLGKYACEFCGKHLKPGAGRAAHLKKEHAENTVRSFCNCTEFL